MNKVVHFCTGVSQLSALLYMLGPYKVDYGAGGGARLEGRRCILPHTERRNDLKRLLHKMLNGNRFRVETGSIGFLLYPVWSEKASLPTCGEPYRAFENVLSGLAQLS